MAASPPEGKPGGPPENQWLELLNLGWIFVASMGVTVFGGLWLDERFKTAPLFILLGVLLGFSVTAIVFWRTLRKFTGEDSGKTSK